MSMSNSEGSSHGGADYKNFRQVTRDRKFLDLYGLLHEMLGAVKQGNSRSTWKVLIMDRFTVKIMSYACKMADITEAGVSLVEDIYKRRQPLPTIDAIYFMQPTKENVTMFMSDMAGKSPIYKKAFVFFSSPISRELVAHVKKDAKVLPRIVALSEMNLEYFAIDSQGFVTDNERTLEELFGDHENQQKVKACLHVMATRIATVFASMRELPFVRYCAAKSLDPMTVTTYRDLLPTKLAAYVWDNLTKYKTTIPNFPQTETCELLVVDRSVDQIAPVIHEWTYDALCHDLLNLEGNKYVHEVPSETGGPPEKKEVFLGEHDPIWLELRHLHFTDANEKLNEMWSNLLSMNKAAQFYRSRNRGDLSPSELQLQKIVQDLPQFVEQRDKFSLHEKIANKINQIIAEQRLKDVAQLEQDLLFGDVGTKEVINFLRTHEVEYLETVVNMTSSILACNRHPTLMETLVQDVSRENKLRLLMVYASVHPEQFEGGKGLKLMQLAKLSSHDMKAVKNMRLLAAAPPSETKESSIGFGGFALNFDEKKRHGVRKQRSGEEKRFCPMIEELVEKLSKGELSKDEYPCMNEPPPTAHTAAAQYSENPVAHSMRSIRTPTWARPRNSDDSVLRHAKMGRRIFVFIVGGATRSEKLKLLSPSELSLDDLEI
ncbi:hypothetical protein Cgig2_031671 [Carnegiea gigantea]|uniref:SNARE-interacting protein KEULE n=1 Tax=Carnegiea gigantea TaxID=171969 RepID=A0A9Q1KS10_9CARY|nr:hypothetical protein Cgig2_031671 [Carnegiea gigantea]